MDRVHVGCLCAVRILWQTVVSKGGDPEVLILEGQKQAISGAGGGVRNVVEVVVRCGCGSLPARQYPSAV
jgi:hypothetical protein